MKSAVVANLPGIQSHTSFFYDSEKQRLELLANYFSTGLELGERCIMVTGISPRKVLDDLQSMGVDFMPAVADEKLIIFNAQTTYLPDGTFNGKKMLSNIRNFMDETAEKGFTGLRTAGEMDWVLEVPGVDDHLASYEAEVNALLNMFRFTGLCLYHTQLLSPSILKRAVLTHPEFMYDQAVYDNPYYVAFQEFSGLAPPRF